MEYRKLGNTDVDVSVICLGTMNWGEQNTEADAHEQMDYAVTTGVNFFDTAEVYPIPPNSESQGKTEEFIGTWFKKTGKRDDVFLASKVVGSGLPYMREWSDIKFDKKNIKVAIEGSLKRLQVEHIDLYQLHWPERKTNFFGKRGYTHDSSNVFTPFQEVLEALQELVVDGKIRYIGLSNERPWGTMEYLRLAKEKDLPRVMSIQNPYSLVMRDYEIGMAEISIREQVGLLAYSPLAMGVLSGKYLDGKRPKGSRFDYSDRNNDRYNPPQAQEAIAKYVSLAKKYNIDPSALALAFVNSREFVTSTIIGATTMDQLKVDIGSIDLKLSEEVLKEIEAIHFQHPNPCA